MYLGVVFGHDVDHAPTHKLKAGLFNFLFLSERYDRNNDPKKRKSDHNLFEKKKKKAAFQFFCTFGPSTRFNFQIENRKFERDIAEMPFPPFF